MYMSESVDSMSRDGLDTPISLQKAKSLRAGISL